MGRRRGHRQRTGIRAASANLRLPVMLGVLAVVVAAASWPLHQNEQDARRALLQRFDARAATGAEFVGAYAETILGRASGLARAQLRGDVSQRDFVRMAQDAGFVAAVLTDGDGRLLAVAPEAPALLGTDVTARYRHLRKALTGQRAVSGAVQSAARGEPIVAFAVPFPTPHGRRVFSGAFPIAVTPLDSFLGNAIPYRPNETYLIDDAGVVVAAGGQTRSGRSTLAMRNPRLAQAVAGGSKGTYDDGGEQLYFTSVPVTDTPWRLVFTAPTRVMYTPLSGPGRWLPWAVLAAFALACLAAMIAFERSLAQRARWRAVLDTTNDAFIGMDSRGRVTDWNIAATTLFGWSASSAIGRDMASLIIPERLRAAHEAGLARFLATGDHSVPPAALQLTALCRDGVEVPVELSLSAMRWKGSWHFHAFLRDITEHVRAAAELTEAERRFRVAFDSAPVGMALTSLEKADLGRLTRVNAALCQMLGYTAEELEQRTFGDITHPDDRLTSQDQAARLRSGEISTLTFEKRYLHADGHAVWVAVHTNVIRDAEDRPRYAVTQMNDITDRRAEEQRLSALATQDPLTGLANRMLLGDRLGQALSRTARSGRTLAVLMCDLDHFKPVNDTFGHAAGDDVLREVAIRIRNSVRPSDTVARLGGDEFVILCEDLDDPATAGVIQHRVEDSLRQPFFVGVEEVRIGGSVGIAVAAGPGIDGDELLARADALMYQRKRSRRAGAAHPATLG